MRRGPSSFWGVGRNDGAREATVDSAVIAVIERLQRNGDYGQHIARLEEIAGFNDRQLPWTAKRAPSRRIRT